MGRPWRRILPALPHSSRREPDVRKPKSSWPSLRALLRSIYNQPDAASVHAQFNWLLDTVTEKLPKFAKGDDHAEHDTERGARPQSLPVGGDAGPSYLWAIPGLSHRST